MSGHESKKNKAQYDKWRPLFPENMTENEVLAILRKCSFNDEKIKNAVEASWEDNSVTLDEWSPPIVKSTRRKKENSREDRDNKSGKQGARGRNVMRVAGRGRGGRGNSAPPRETARRVAQGRGRPTDRGSGGVAVGRGSPVDRFSSGPGSQTVQANLQPNVAVGTRAVNDAPHADANSAAANSWGAPISNINTNMASGWFDGGPSSAVSPSPALVATRQPRNAWGTGRTAASLMARPGSTVSAASSTSPSLSPVLMVPPDVDALESSAQSLSIGSSAAGLGNTGMGSVPQSLAAQNLAVGMVNAGMNRQDVDRLAKSEGPSDVASTPPTQPSTSQSSGPRSRGTAGSGPAGSLRNEDKAPVGGVSVGAGPVGAGVVGTGQRAVSPVRDEKKGAAVASPKRFLKMGQWEPTATEANDAFSFGSFGFAGTVDDAAASAWGGPPAHSSQHQNSSGWDSASAVVPTEAAEGWGDDDLPTSTPNDGYANVGGTVRASPVDGPGSVDVSTAASAGLSPLMVEEKVVPSRGQTVSPSGRQQVGETQGASATGSGVSSGGGNSVAGGSSGVASSEPGVVPATNPSGGASGTTGRKPGSTTVGVSGAQRGRQDVSHSMTKADGFGPGAAARYGASVPGSKGTHMMKDLGGVSGYGAQVASGNMMTDARISVQQTPGLGAPPVVSVSTQPLPAGSVASGLKPSMTMSSAMPAASSQPASAYPGMTMQPGPGYYAPTSFGFAPYANPASPPVPSAGWHSGYGYGFPGPYGSGSRGGTAYPPRTGQMGGQIPGYMDHPAQGGYPHAMYPTMDYAQATGQYGGEAFIQMQATGPSHVQPQAQQHSQQQNQQPVQGGGANGQASKMGGTGRGQAGTDSDQGPSSQGTVTPLTQQGQPQQQPPQQQPPQLGNASHGANAFGYSNTGYGQSLNGRGEVPTDVAALQQWQQQQQHQNAALQYQQQLLAQQQMSYSQTGGPVSGQVQASQQMAGLQPGYGGQGGPAFAYGQSMQQSMPQTMGSPGGSAAWPRV